MLPGALCETRGPCVDAPCKNSAVCHQGETGPDYNCTCLQGTSPLLPTEHPYNIASTTQAPLKSTWWTYPVTTLPPGRPYPRMLCEVTALYMDNFQKPTDYVLHKVMQLSNCWLSETTFKITYISIA